MNTVDLNEFRQLQLPHEAQVMATWPASKAPLISVLCPTYNKRPFIDDALRGFLMQRTSFAFEIVMHDDASTDGTAEIIQQYAARYPNIIKPYLQSENQYSKGRKIIALAAMQASGKLLALCDGDDFWVDPSKLARQVAQMDGNSQCAISFHASLYLDESQHIARERVRDRFLFPVRPHVFSVQDVIIGEGHFMPTASIILRRSAIDDLPDWYQRCPVGDYFLQVLAAIPNGALYLPEPASCYRRFAAGSWSRNRSSPEHRIALWRSMARAYDDLDRHTEYRYSGAIRGMYLRSTSYLFRNVDIAVETKRELLKEARSRLSKPAFRLLSLSLHASANPRAAWAADRLLQLPRILESAEKSLLSRVLM